MPERWFCWFDNYSTTVNKRGQHLPCVCVCVCVCVREKVYVCVHMLEIALLSVSMCESEGERERERERRVEKTKREAVHVCFSPASHRNQQNETLHCSRFRIFSLSFISMFIFFFFLIVCFVFFFQHMKTEDNSTNRYRNAQVIYCIIYY